MKRERWRRVVGWEDRYEVSDRGRVRSPFKILSQCFVGRYPALSLTRPMDGGQFVKLRHVHRLVLEAFVGPCPAGQEARHLNDIPCDNWLTNLVWGTSKQNRADARRNAPFKEERRRREAEIREQLLRDPGRRRSRVFLRQIQKQEEVALRRAQKQQERRVRKQRRASWPTIQEPFVWARCESDLGFFEDALYTELLRAANRAGVLDLPDELPPFLGIVSMICGPNGADDAQKLLEDCLSALIEKGKVRWSDDECLVICDYHESQYQRVDDPEAARREAYADTKQAIDSGIIKPPFWWEEAA